MSDARGQMRGLRQLFEEEMRVALVAEPLEVAGADEPAGEVAARLAAKGFDECGVVRSRRVEAVVRRDRLAGGGTAGDHAEPVPLGRVVAGSTPLWACMRRVAEHGSVYVLSDRPGTQGITGGLGSIVTRADLDKQPARMLMFGLISVLEMAMLALIRRRCPVEWETMINERRLKQARELHKKREEANQETDLLECLQLCDKATICCRMPGVLEAWGLSKTQATDLLGRVEGIRNQLAHAQSASGNGTWSKVVESLERADVVAERCVELAELADAEGGGADALR